MITLLKHGGHHSDTAHAATKSGGVTVLEDTATAQDPSRFDYMFPNLARDPLATLSNDASTVKQLVALGKAMIDAAGEPESDDSQIPAIYTYWGQFIDHDITANTDRNSGVNDITPLHLNALKPDDVIANIKNLRQPAFDLDSLYDKGPAFDGKKTPSALFYDGIKFRLGKVVDAGANFERIPNTNDLDRDVPRIGTLIEMGLAKEEDFPIDLRKHPAFLRLPWIGDMRNDENTVVSQFHVAMLRFHNAVVDWVKLDDPEKSDRETFESAKQLTTWHYQWLVINDFLRKITYPGTVDEIVFGGRKFFDPEDSNGEFMPLEHSVATYRFGHSMVRASYDFNRNFGRGVGNTPFQDEAAFAQLFQFTGVGGFANTVKLPSNWVIEFDRFVESGSPFRDRFARKIDTRIAPPLALMKNQIEGTPSNLGERIKEMLQHLAIRNLLRGFLLCLPTGQAIAQRMGFSVLTEDELKLNNSEAINQILIEGGFLEKTPLWYYILKEAEVKAGGQTLGPVGSRIVAETFIGVIDKDANSYRRKNWNPGKGVRLLDGRCVVTIKDLINFASLPA